MYIWEDNYFEKPLLCFGEIKGSYYTNIGEPISICEAYKNCLGKEIILQHMKKISEESEDLILAPGVAHDAFTGEIIGTIGYFRDGDFIIALEFIHYLENYDIGVPLEYEEYLKTIL